MEIRKIPRGMTESEWDYYKELCSKHKEVQNLRNESLDILRNDDSNNLFEAHQQMSDLGGKVRKLVEEIIGEMHVTEESIIYKGIKGEMESLGNELYPRDSE